MSMGEWGGVPAAVGAGGQGPHVAGVAAPPVGCDVRRPGDGEVAPVGAHPLVGAVRLVLAGCRLAVGGAAAARGGVHPAAASLVCAAEHAAAVGASTRRTWSNTATSRSTYGSTVGSSPYCGSTHIAAHAVHRPWSVRRAPGCGHLGSPPFQRPVP